MAKAQNRHRATCVKADDDAAVVAVLVLPLACVDAAALVAVVAVGGVVSSAASAWGCRGAPVLLATVTAATPDVAGAGVMAAGGPLVAPALVPAKVSALALTAGMSGASPVMPSSKRV